MSSIGTDVMFVLPRPVATPFSTHVRLVSPRPGSPLALPSTEFRLDEFEHVTFRTVDAALGDPYQRRAEFRKPGKARHCRIAANPVARSDSRQARALGAPRPGR
jgi:glycogen synthase